MEIVDGEVIDKKSWEKYGEKYFAEKYQGRPCVAHCIAGLIVNEDTLKTFKGKLEGKIDCRSGEKGFGWDKIFYPTVMGDYSLADMAKIKHKINVRRDPYLSILMYLKQLHIIPLTG